MANHIDCEEVISRLLEFLDRELDDGTREAIEEHLRHCRGCFTRAEFERRLRRRVAQTGEVEAPESLRRRLRILMEGF